MFRFHFRRNIRDIISHLILICLPVLIIAFFHFVFADSGLETGMAAQTLPYITVLTVGFALNFQVYGSANSFEVLGGDFLSPMRDRLVASPTEPRSIVASILSAGCLVSYLQTLAVLAASSIILNANLGPLQVVLPIFLLSVVFNQLLGSAILVLSRSVKTANAIITVYGAIAPMTLGLYFPLPQNAFFDLLRTYLSPMALANTAILGAVEGDFGRSATAAGILLLLSVILFLVLRPLIRRLEQ